MIALLAAGVLLTPFGTTFSCAATNPPQCGSALIEPFIPLDDPPCPKPGERKPQDRCTGWVIRQHYHLRHTAPWPRDGDACDPIKAAPEGYECHDDDSDRPPPGMSW
jgi:hypothetical protein